MDTDRTTPPEPPDPLPSAAADSGEPEEAAGAPSRFERWRQQAVDSGERVQSWAEAAREHSPPVDAALTMIGRIRIVQLSLITGYVALRLFILLFPLAYLVIAGLGLAASRQEALEASDDVGISGALADSIAEAAEASDRGHWLALVVGLMATAWAGRGALRALRIAHADAWRLPVPKTGYASIGGLPLAAGLLGLLVYNTWVAGLRDDGLSPVLAFIAQGVVIAAVGLGGSLILPRAAGSQWTDLLPGALLYGVAGPSLNLAVAIYFGPRLARTQATYGVLGIGVVLLTYLLVIAWMISLAAELNAGLYAWRQSRQAAAPSSSRSADA